MNTAYDERGRRIRNTSLEKNLIYYTILIEPCDYTVQEVISRAASGWLRLGALSQVQSVLLPCGCGGGDVEGRGVQKPGLGEEGWDGLWLDWGGGVGWGRLELLLRLELGLWLGLELLLWLGLWLELGLRLELGLGLGLGLRGRLELVLELNWRLDRARATLPLPLSGLLLALDRLRGELELLLGAFEL